MENMRKLMEGFKRSLNESDRIRDIESEVVLLSNNGEDPTSIRLAIQNKFGDITQDEDNAMEDMIDSHYNVVDEALKEADENNINLEVGKTYMGKYVTDDEKINDKEFPFAFLGEENGAYYILNNPDSYDASINLTPEDVKNGNYDEAMDDDITYLKKDGNEFKTEMGFVVEISSI